MEVMAIDNALAGSRPGSNVEGVTTDGGRSELAESLSGLGPEVGYETPKSDVGQGSCKLRDELVRRGTGVVEARAAPRVARLVRWESYGPGSTGWEKLGHV